MIENLVWDKTYNSIDFLSCGEDFKEIFEDSGLRKKDLNDNRKTLIVLDALLKFRILEK